MEKNEKINLNKPEYFFNRELSWLKFNLRVLREAGVKTTPLLERLKFVAITASNLDEFFMVRVAGLWDQYENGINKRDAAGLTVKAQLEEISKAAHDQMKLLNKYLLSLVKELREAGIYICRVSELSEKGRRWLEAYYQEEIFPVLTPMAVDASRPFPFLANKTLNLAVELTNQEGEDSMGIVQVPSVLPRLLEVPGEEKRSFVFLEDVINEHCYDLYSGCKILDVVPFRITRDADLEFDEDDIDNLLKEVEKSLRKRTRGASVRLEIYNKANSRIRKFLYNNLDITEQEVYEINGPLDATCFFKFASLPGMWPWLYEPFVPQRPLELPDDSDIFKVLRERDVLLHHPYESFDPVVKFVSDAADDPNVLAIKQTLYRVSGNSPIVAALARAAENGKQVTVLVELKARFDEENNIAWSRMLEDAGCHVIYGLDGYKVHSKLCLITRKSGTRIEYITQIGTGNYNEKTSRLYTDLSLITSNSEIGLEAFEVFQALSLGETVEQTDVLFVAPNCLQNKVLDRIDQEIKLTKEGKKGYLGFKLNSLTDKRIIDKLIEASQAGVQIDMVVRGICCLQPGIPGYTDHIRIISIVGRYLEHSRIYIFGTGDREEIYISSADFMTRNTLRRVEVSVPIFNSKLREELKEMFGLMLSDNVKARELGADGTYRKVSTGDTQLNSQEVLFQIAYDCAQTGKGEA